ncbi:MAG: hypothetical protein HYW78_00080 [Parcubacteria group bacterium]|nr:hypothetical protein [Parcubacteria group bacterium]
MDKKLYLYLRCVYKNKYTFTGLISFVVGLSFTILVLCLYGNINPFNGSIRSIILFVVDFLMLLYGSTALATTLFGFGTYYRYIETIDYFKRHQKTVIDERYKKRFTMYCDKVGLALAINDFKKKKQYNGINESQLKNSIKKLEKIERLASPYL